MASNRLNFGKIVASAVFKNGDNSFIRINGDFTSGSPNVTSVVNNAGGNVNFSEALIGQKLVQSSAYPSGATITNISGDTITLDSNAGATVSSGLGRISPASDSFYIESGSLTVPSNAEFRLTDVTGSDDASYQSGTRTYGLIFPLASTSSAGSTIVGEFAQLKISKFGSRVSNVEASFYISASADGINGIPTGRTQVTSNTTFAIVEQSVSESMAPIFSAADVSISTGYSLAGYQTAVDTVFDTFATGSGVSTGGTGSFSGSFTGSFKGDITASKLTNALTDGSGITDFSFDGSSAATVSVQVSGSTLEAGANGLRVKPQGITESEITSSALSQSGALFGGNGNKFGVAVDGNTVIIGAGGTLQVKTGGLPTSSLATSSFTLGSTVVELGDTKTTLNKLNLTAVTASGEFSGSASGSFQGDGSGLTGIASSLQYSASLGSGSVNLKTQAFNILAGEGIDTSGSNNTITISGEDATTANKGIASFDSSDFQVSSGAVSLANSLSIPTMSIGEDLTVGLDATVNQDLTVTRNAVIQGNLSVQGTASFQHESNLDVADRFIRLASGSTSNGDGGLAVQQTAADNTELFGFDYNANRWGFTSSFDPGAGSGFVPKSFVAAVANNNGISGSSTFQAAGNIYVDGNGEIYIYT
tara:strand:- start:2575 stop:4518 length:1944 start_codon:yes stop_codon:yes gene_type:complete